MSDTYLSLMKGVIAQLKGKTAVTNLVGTRIYSNVPKKETFPYVLISITSSDFSTKTFSGMDHTIQLNIYSRKPSVKQAGDIRKACYDALHRKESEITLDTGSLAILQFNGLGDIFKDTDGVTIEAVSQFRAVVT